MIDRKLTRPTLVYVHCNVYWNLDEGSLCPCEHDFSLTNPGPRGRKRRVWICNENGEEVTYLTRKAYLEHDKENCYADI